MKFACSSRSFAPAFAEGRITHLEWLDVCANELEVDGVVLTTSDFPRTDDDYLAQVKKTAVDLGLTIAAVEAADVWNEPAAALAVAIAVGAPLVATCAAAEATEPEAAGAFIAAAGGGARGAHAACRARREGRERDARAPAGARHALHHGRGAQGAPQGRRRCVASADVRYGRRPARHAA